MLMPFIPPLSDTGFTTGTFAEAEAQQINVSAATGQHAGFQFTAPASGTLSTVKITVTAVGASGDWVSKLYTNNAGSPGTQIGSDGSSLTISATGDKTLTCAGDQVVTGGGTYWIVLSPASGTPDIDLSACVDSASYGSGRNNTITSITNGLPSSRDWRVEIVAT